MSNGTLSGAGDVTVTGTCDWTGGTMSGSDGDAATTTIAGGATWFIDGSGPQQASNRDFTINSGGSVYLFDGAELTFSNDSLANAGTFTSYDATSISGSGSFSNSGVFNCGGADGNECLLTVPFSNSAGGQVNIQSGALVLLSGQSSGAWSISPGAALMLAGGGSGASAQVFLFTAATTIACPAPASGTTGPGQYGVVIVNGSGDGGLGVQAALSVMQLSLMSGTISGYGTLTVTGRMTWSGGTMTSAADPNDPSSYGSTTIAGGGALFLLGTPGSNGQAQTLGLGRPLNILGHAGWVGNEGAVALNLPSAAGVLFQNNAATLKSPAGATLAAMPAATAWGGLLGGYGNALDLAAVLQQVLSNRPGGAAVAVPVGWGNISLTLGKAVVSFFETLPAIERAALDVTFALQNNGQTLTDAVAASAAGASLREQFSNSLHNGDRAVSGEKPPPASLLGFLQMLGGILAGVAVGLAKQVIALPLLVIQLSTSPKQTVNAVWSGLQSLFNQIKQGNVAEALSKVFPNVAATYTLWNQQRLMSFQGGMAMGQALVKVTTTALGGYGLIRSIPQLMKAVKGAVVSVAKGTAQQAAKAGLATVSRTVVRVGTEVVKRPAAVAGQAALALAKGLGQAGVATATGLKNQLLAPYKAVWRRVDNARRTFSLTVLSNKACFVAGTPLLTPDGAKPIEEFQVGDLILSRHEDAPEGEIQARRVEDVFTRTAPILRLTVSGQEIGTTYEHPFYVIGKGWRAAGELRPGDWLVSHNGVRVMIEAVTATTEVTTVYNLRVAEFHTYFVGREEWGCSVWAHNTTTCVIQEAAGWRVTTTDNTGKVIRTRLYTTQAEANLAAAATRLGINDLNAITVDANGVATLPGGQAELLRRADVQLLIDHLRTQGATSMTLDALVNNQALGRALELKPAFAMRGFLPQGATATVTFRSKLDLGPGQVVWSFDITITW